jgi:hypothetical protein
MDIYFFTVCVGKSVFVLLTLLNPALGCPLSNRCCWCAGIVLQNGCQVADRVTDVCGKSVINGITWKISSQLSGRARARARVCVCVCAVVNIKWIDFDKRGCFL